MEDKEQEGPAKYEPPLRGFKRPIDALLDLALWASLDEGGRKALGLVRRYQRERPQREAGWARQRAEWDALKARADRELEAKRQSDTQRVPPYKGLADEERAALLERYPDFYRRLVAAHNRLTEVGRRMLAQEQRADTQQEQADEEEADA